jgi:hypothetical protein
METCEWERDLTGIEGAYSVLHMLTQHRIDTDVYQSIQSAILLYIEVTIMIVSMNTCPRGAIQTTYTQWGICLDEEVYPIGLVALCRATRHPVLATLAMPSRPSRHF